LRQYLDEFARVGLAGASGGKYWRKNRADLLIGVLQGSRSGHAFVVPDARRERETGDLYINQRSLGPAMHGDTVIARVLRHGAKGREGLIESVLFRSNPTVVGRFIESRKESFVSPIEDRFLYEINVAPEETMGAADGQIVNVEITRPPVAGRLPRGRIIEVLGDDNTPGIDAEIIVRKHNLPHLFPESAINQAGAAGERISEEEAARRTDLRDQVVITIDGETARDFDDAVSLEITGHGRYRLGVHIADVSHYVKEGTALDAEALRRGTSVYFPERAIPMLPERLSNNICSLNPRVDRLTMSAILELDRTGRVVDYVLAPSMIRSRERMTYTAVNEVLTDPSSGAGRAYSHVKPMLLLMHELALVLIGRREKRGAIDFDLPEAELLFNDEGQICGVARSERNIAHRLIEEFMLLANETVAAHLESLGVPAVYRVHDPPSPLKIEEFATIVESFGHKFSIHGPAPQRGFQHLLRQIAGLPEERMISYLMLRAMERARYSEQNRGHFGLAMKSYTHFTSPIRRYPDLVVHRILREVLDRGREMGRDDLGKKRVLNLLDEPVFDEDRETELRRTLSAIADHSSEREAAADAAERELIEWRKADFMAEKLGEQFGGIIVDVKEYGFYVELDEHFVQGLVHVSTLRDDLYEFQERKRRLVGRRSGRSFRLGERVAVSVDRVDRGRHLIDFSLVWQ
jgi:ribonuclease R